MAVARDLKIAVAPELCAQLELRVSTPELGFVPTNELLSRVMPKGTKAARRKQAIIVLAGLVGAMILARSTPEGALSQEILQTMSGAIPGCVDSSRHHRGGRVGLGRRLPHSGSGNRGEGN